MLAACEDFMNLENLVWSIRDCCSVSEVKRVVVW